MKIASAVAPEITWTLTVCSNMTAPSTLSRMRQVTGTEAWLAVPKFLTLHDTGRMVSQVQNRPDGLVIPVTPTSLATLRNPMRVL